MSAALSAFDCSSSERPVSVRSVGRRGGKALERGPDGFLDFRGDGDFLVSQQRADPLGGPASFREVIDATQRLKGKRSVRCERMVLATHGQHGGAR